MVEIITITLPIFVIIAAGWILKRFNVVKHSWIKVLNDFVYFVALPALIIEGFSSITWDSNLVYLVGVNTIYITAISLILFVLFSLLPITPKIKATLFLMGIVGNTVYMGFPIIASFTKLDINSIAPIPTLYLIYSMLIGLLVIKFWVNKKKKISIYVYDLVKNPLFLSVIAGVLISLFFNIDEIPSISTPLKMVALTASPLALFTLGAFLNEKFTPKYLGYAVALSIFKIIVFPLTAIVALINFNLSNENLSISVIGASMPIAVTVFILTEKYNLDSKLAASGIVISTITSFVTVTLFLSFLRGV